MPSFGKKSQERLATCHPDLQKLFEEVVKHYDCAILCGYRGKEEQDEAVFTGKSKKEYPSSKHNVSPSLAVDVAPYPIDWDDLDKFLHFAGFVSGIASQMGIKVRWGGDWDSDFNFKEEKFIDMPHWELVK